MRCPVGVTLDMDPTTEVQWYDIVENKLVTSLGTAPQFHVTKYAADPANYIWRCAPQGSAAAELLFQPVYKTADLELTDMPMTVRLYKEDSVATSSDLQTETIAKVANADGDPVDGFWVGKAGANGTLTLNSETGKVERDTNEEAEDTRADAVSSGVAIKSFLYDQYDIAFQDKKNELKLVPASDPEEKNGPSPFEVVPASGGKNGWYTIKYRSGMGINNVVEGEYILKADYDVIREPHVDTSKTLYVKKGEDRFSYMDTNLSGKYKEVSVQEVEEPVEGGGTIKGKIIEVEYEVPERTGKTTVSQYPVIRITELANQWREPGDSLEDDTKLQDYDIVSGIRESEGSAAISISKARLNGFLLNYELTYPGSEDGGEEPRGLKFGVEKTVGGEKQFVPISESGQFTYSSDVLHETWFNCRITATYQGESRFVEYRFKFVRDVDNLKLSGIVLTPPTDPNSDHIRVPLPNEAENVVKVQLVMKDQYNSDLSQDYVLEAYAPGGSMNNVPGEEYWPDYPNWGISLYEDPNSSEPAALPKGVRIDKENGTIIVSSEAEDDSSFQIYGKLGMTESDPVTVRVSRDGSKPETVTAITYSKQGSSATVTELDSPGRNNVSDNVYTPSVQVFNQYLRKLEPSELVSEVRGYYKPTWTLDKVIPASARDYLEINSFTGALTVKKCAPNCTVTVKMRADTRYGSNSQTITLAVKRAQAIPDTLAVADNQVSYPTADEKLDDVQNAFIALTATGTTQYGDDQVFKHGEGEGDISLIWTLEAVEFLGPTGTGGYKLDRQRENSSTGEMEDTGDIVNESGSWVAWDSVELSDSGVLHFRDITERQKMPVAVWVVARFGTTTTGEPHKIEINWNSTDIPQEIAVPNEYKYSSGIQIPGLGDPVEVPLKGNVRNQYGIIINTPVVWSAAEEVPGMKLVKKADGSYAVQVDYTATAGNTLQLTAKCENAENVSVSLPITAIQNEELRVDSVAVTGLRDPSGNTLRLTTKEDGVQEITIPLPAKTGKGYDTYKIVCSVLSQFRQPMSGEVQWEIESDFAGVEASFIDDGVETVKDIRIFFTEDARDALIGNPVKTDVTFTVRASCEGKPDPSDTEKQKESSCVIHLKLADSEVAYAVPQVVSCTNSHEETVDGVTTVKPCVPEWGTPATEVELKATVYDQYGVEMPGETAEMQLLTMDPSLTFNGRILSITSTFIGNLATIQATPKDMPDAVQEESRKLIEMYANPAYPFGVAIGAIGENSVFDTEVQYQSIIPVWESKTTYVKDEDTVLSMPLEANVVNQREGVVDWDPSLYPIWEFVGDHTGVEFGDPVLDENGNVKGSTVTLNITNQAAQAIPDGKTDCMITLKVRTNGKTGGYFEKTVKVRLTRNRRVATYLYIEGSDEIGEDREGLRRPYAEDKTTVYKFTPVVYDQYGQPLDVSINMDLDIEALKDVHDIRVEKEYKRGESEEKGDEPISYKIYWVEEEPTETEKGKETLIAEFSRETGNLTLYTACDSSILPSLRFTAKYGDLPLKSLKVYNVQETSIPYTVKVNRSHGDFTVSGGTEPVSDYITPVVSDQYGQPFPLNRLLTIQWALYMPEKDENGGYVPYKDYDQEGHERLPADYLIVKKDTVDKTYSTVLTVQPEQFYANQTAILQCVVSYMDSGRQVRLKIQDTLIRVSRPTAGGGITVTFDAGEYGKLVGTSMFELNIGETPNAPGVKTVTGYGFMGWTADGETVVDASKIPLFEDTSYVAVYKDITNTKFLEGYKDGTVRPETAVTRAEFITMLARALGGYDSSKNYGASYRDVAQGKWYANYIAFAKQKGLTSGYPDGTFRPDSPITRAEAARLLAVAADLPLPVGAPENGKGSFSDVKADAWYAKSVEALYAAGIASGYPDGTYRPDRRITRAEAVRLVIMMTENAPNELERKNIQEYAYCPFSDIKKGHWAYAYILRAAGIA